MSDFLYNKIAVLNIFRLFSPRQQVGIFRIWFKITKFIYYTSLFTISFPMHWYILDRFRLRFCKQYFQQSRNYIHQNYTLFPINNAFPQPSLSVAKLSHELSLIAWMLHNTYKHHHTETLFIFSIFESMSRPRSIYVVSMWSFFHFHSFFILFFSNHIISLKQIHSIFCTYF